MTTSFYRYGRAPRVCPNDYDHVLDYPDPRLSAGWCTGCRSFVQPVQRPIKVKVFTTSTSRVYSVDPVASGFTSSTVYVDTSL